MPDSDIRPSIEGRLFLAGSSRFVTGSIRRDGDGFTIRDADGTVVASSSRKKVWIDKPITGMPWRIRFPSGEAFEAEGADCFHALMGKSPRSRALIVGGWTALLGTAACVLVLFWIGFPIVVDRLAVKVPTRVEQALGDDLLSQYDGAVFQKTQLSQSIRRSVRAVFDNVREAAGLPKDSVRLEFRRSDLFGANAFALPGGTIVLLDDLARLVRRQDELAAVLAHELAHIHHRHYVRQIARTAGLSVLAVLVMGDTAGMSNNLASFGVDLASVSYSREFETEADAAAAETLNRMGMDPTAMIDLLRRIDEKCGADCEETGFLATHPGFRDRLETLKGGGS